MWTNETSFRLHWHQLRASQLHHMGQSHFANLQTVTLSTEQLQQNYIAIGHESYMH